MGRRVLGAGEEEAQFVLRGVTALQPVYDRSVPSAADCQAAPTHQHTKSRTASLYPPPATHATARGEHSWPNSYEVVEPPPAAMVGAT